MKKLSIYTILMAIVMVGISACGPSEEERQAAEQARLDSLRQVQEQRIAEMMQAREDSIARAQMQNEAMEEEEEQEYQFTDDGTYIAQVGAFRSEDAANNYKTKLTDRDFPNVYTVKIGNEETGDIWFRLRVGFFANKADAEELGADLGAELNTGYWVSKVERSGN